MYVVRIMWHRSALSRALSRALGSWPDRNIGNQRGRTKIPPDVPVPVRPAAGGGIVLFLLFVVSLDHMHVIKKIIANVTAGFKPEYPSVCGG